MEHVFTFNKVRIDIDIIQAVRGVYLESDLIGGS